MGGVSGSLPAVFISLLIMLCYCCQTGRAQVIFVLNGSTQQTKSVSVLLFFKFFSFGFFYSIYCSKNKI